MFRFLVPPVYLEDVLMRGAFGGYVWVVLPAQDIWSALKCVMADSPAPFGVAVDLSDAGVHTESHRGNERGLAEIGAKT